MALQEELEEQGVWLFRYRSTLPLILLFMGGFFFVMTKLNPNSFFLEETPCEVYYEMVCLLVSLLGLAVRIYTVGHTPENTSGRNVHGQLADSLNTTGFYSVVRHPLYVGNFLMWLGPALLTGNFWFATVFILFYWVYYERIMFAEEQFLRGKFGQTYLDWSKNVPAFIPSFKNFVKPNLTYSLKKILKKEKNGLAAVFIIFFIFEYTGELIQGKHDFNYFIMAGCVLSVIAYLVLRYLKRNTSVLDEQGR